jgi:hypothetical protein
MDKYAVYQYFYKEGQAAAIKEARVRNLRSKARTATGSGASTGDSKENAKSMVKEVAVGETADAVAERGGKAVERLAKSYKTQGQKHLAKSLGVLGKSAPYLSYANDIRKGDFKGLANRFKPWVGEKDDPVSMVGDLWSAASAPFNPIEGIPAAGRSLHRGMRGAMVRGKAIQDTAVRGDRREGKHLVDTDPRFM